MSLDASKKFAEIRLAFKDDPKADKLNALVCGEMGTGKTHLIKTCPKPVLFHNFDPGGYKTLRKEIEKGEILVENFAPDDPLKPWAYSRWDKTMESHLRQGLFDAIGTFVLDSSTMWAEAIMNEQLKKAGSPGKPPVWQRDYTPQKVEIRNWLTRILGLPCHVIVTGHLEPQEDKVTGRVTYRYATTGKGTFLIPAMFDEVYVTLAEESPRGVAYKIQTAGAGRYAARSRLATDGKIEQFETPDIKALLEKAGFPADDKDLFKV